jgi:RHS repeat-associated protein
MQITYSMSGADLFNCVDLAGTTTQPFEHDCQGNLGTGQLHLTGSVSVQSGYSASLRVLVSTDTCKTGNQFTADIPSGGVQNFDVSCSISTTDTGGDWFVLMEGWSNCPPTGCTSLEDIAVAGHLSRANPTAGTLSVTPSDGLSSSGNQGGPFSPSSKNYTLQNTGGSSINWSASKGQTWVSLSGTSGTLAAGASTTVTVSINSNANSLTAGSYSYIDTVSFTNTTNGNGNTSRGVNLTVSAINTNNTNLGPENNGGPKDNRYTNFDGGEGPGGCGGGMPNYWINTANLRLAVGDTDFSYRGLGPEIVMTRTYNADPSYSGMFGRSWSFSYESIVDETGQAQTPKTVSLVKGSGQKIQYTIDLSKAPPVQGTPPEGVYDSLTWDGKHWLLGEKETHWTYSYEKVDGSNFSRLAAVADPDGNEVDTYYNSDGTLDMITDAGGRVTSFGYDASKHCISMTPPNGGQATYTYDGSGNLAKTVDLLGFEADYQYNSAGYMVAMTVGMKTTQFGWDSSIPGWTRIATVTDALGNVTKYTVNSSDYSVSISDPLGGTKSYKSEKGRNVNEVDQLGNQISKTFTNGLPVQIKDSKGNVTHMEYDSRGNRTKITDPLGKATTYGYDTNDNLISKKDPLGNTWTFTYDDFRHLTKSKSPMGNATVMAYDDMGQLIQTTDANGNITTFTYDDISGNLIGVTDPLGNKTSMSYDSSNINRTSVTDARGNTTRVEYDKNNRITKVTYSGGTFRVYSYDCCADTSATDENGNTSILNRDPLLDITQITDPLGKTTQRTFDKNSNLVSIVDALGHQMTMTYDGVDRLISKTDPKGHTVQMNYDANGNLTSFKDERGKETHLAYDNNNLLVSTTDALNRTVTKARDALGRTVTLTNARGGKIGMTYDGDGRMTGKSYDGTVAATYGYDNVDNPTSVSDATGVTKYGYDTRNQVSGIQYPDGKSVSFTYDSAGNVSTITYPGGLAVSYTYDSRNRVATMAWSGNSVAYTYDGVGNVTNEARSNGTETTYAYDKNNLPVQITHQKGASPFAQMNYTRDAIGNTVQEARTLPLSPHITAESVPATYNDVNQINKWGADNYTYDYDGNLTSIAGTESLSVLYDQANVPTAITGGGITTNYTYDGLGNRTKAVRGSDTRNYHYDREGRLLFETNQTGQVTVLYVYQGGQLAAMATLSGSYFYHFDKTGNTMAITDGSGNVTSAYVYDAFGSITNVSGSMYNPFTYVGALGVMDEGGGLYFMKNRYYDAVTGKFIQKDPIGFLVGINLYQYVLNNPVERTDSWGLAKDTSLDAMMSLLNFGFGTAAFIVAGVVGGSGALISSPILAPVTVAGLALYGYGRLKASFEQGGAVGADKPTFNYNSGCERFVASPAGGIPFAKAFANLWYPEGNISEATKDVLISSGKLLISSSLK